jgi:uncharacterized membrane protein YkoI
VLVDDVATATGIAMQQAQRAGVGGVFTTVRSVKKQNNDNWEVILDYVGTKYKTVIDSKSGKIIEWEVLGR